MDEQRIREIVREEIAAIKEEEARKVLESIRDDLKKRPPTKDVAITVDGAIIGGTIIGSNLRSQESA